MIGHASGGAVRLAPVAEVLQIAEGIETAAAVQQATVQATWAALSASGLAALRLPPIVRTVIICADNDGAGQRAAWIAAERWCAEGRRVRIAIPPEPDTDFVDLFLGRGIGSIVEVSDVAA
jgi:putative DNA primase/helicase